MMPNNHAPAYISVYQTDPRQPRVLQQGGVVYEPVEEKPILHTGPNVYRMSPTSRGLCGLCVFLTFVAILMAVAVAVPVYMLINQNHQEYSIDVKSAFVMPQNSDLQPILSTIDVQRTLEQNKTLSDTLNSLTKQLNSIIPRISENIDNIYNVRLNLNQNGLIDVSYTIKTKSIFSVESGLIKKKLESRLKSTPVYEGVHLNGGSNAAPVGVGDVFIAEPVVGLLKTVKITVPDDDAPRPTLPPILQAISDTTTKRVFLNSFDEQSELDDLLGAKHKFEPLITTTELPDLSYNPNAPPVSQYASIPSENSYNQQQQPPPAQQYNNQPPVQSYEPPVHMPSYNGEYQPVNSYQPNQNSYATPASYPSQYPVSSNYNGNNKYEAAGSYQAPGPVYYATTYRTPAREEPKKSLIDSAVSTLLVDSKLSELTDTLKEIAVDAAALTTTTESPLSKVLGEVAADLVFNLLKPESKLKDLLNAKTQALQTPATQVETSTKSTILPLKPVAVQQVAATTKQPPKSDSSVVPPPALPARPTDSLEQARKVLAAAPLTSVKLTDRVN